MLTYFDKNVPVSRVCNMLLGIRAIIKNTTPMAIEKGFAFFTLVSFFRIYTINIQEIFR